MGAMEAFKEFAPTTFVERGTAVPFTTPGLEQARLRAAGGGRFELLVQSLSGGRGVYIMSWAGVCEMVPVTLHDQLLYDALLKGTAADPLAVREAALATALEGAAGPGAAEAAAKARAADHDLGLLIQFRLIASLLANAGREEIGYDDIVSGGEAVLTTVRKLLREAAPDIGLDADEVFSALGAMAPLLVPFGLPGGDLAGRLRILLETIDDLTTDLKSWARYGNRDQEDVVDFILGAMAVTLKASRPMLNALDAELLVPTALLASFIHDGGPLVRRLLRCAWMLDGWEYIVTVWKTARDRYAQRTAVLEIARLIPAMPREAAEWTGLALALPDASRFHKRLVKSNEDWRGKASLLDLIERNEQRKQSLS